ncbi:MAG: ABC transporter permease [Spirochaetes bacterium]|nr:ABC transporter permease [Spirochaetota bacterium]
MTDKLKFKYTSVYINILIILIIILSSVFAEEISGYSPFEINFSGMSAPDSSHLCGTDFLGRDILGRTLIGGRISVIIGVLARLGSILFGLLIGLLIGLSGSRIKPLLNSVVEIFLAIPSLLLAMGLAVSLGEGYLTIVVSIIAGTWAPVAKFVSVQTNTVKKYDYVKSARVIGAGNLRVVSLYILPALLPLLLPLMTTGIATSIMLESTLSFLGLAGTASINTLPSWGQMIQEGSKFIFDAPWIILPPSIILTILILCFNSIGDKLVQDTI